MRRILKERVFQGKIFLPDGNPVINSITLNSDNTVTIEYDT